uniref:Uncharacterized protein n=1 Tax=Sinocyclocheilus rhinocerous TaxID=307959 RepID=A0A673N277_9TELE
MVLSSKFPADLSPEERSELEEIRRRKGALLLEIQRLKEELREAIIEVEGLESSTEGRLKSRHVAMGRKKFNMDPKKLKKHIIFHILYIIVSPLCPAFLKRVDFYKAHRSEKARCALIGQLSSAL